MLTWKSTREQHNADKGRRENDRIPNQPFVTQREYTNYLLYQFLEEHHKYKGMTRSQ